MALHIQVWRVKPDLVWACWPPYCGALADDAAVAIKAIQTEYPHLDDWQIEDHRGEISELVGAGQIAQVS